MARVRTGHRHGRLGRALLCGALAAVTSAVAIGLAAPATAESAGRFSLAPLETPGSAPARSDFSYALRPGQRATDAVELSNFSASPQTFSLYAADGYNTANGGLALRRSSGHRSGIAGWIQLATDRCTVPGHTVATVPFALTVPPGAPAGDHVGGIVALDATGGVSNDHGVRVSVHQGVAVAVFARVLGPLHRSVAVVAVGARSSGSPFATLGVRRITPYATVRNTGNVALQATVRVTLTDGLGHVVERFPAVRLPVLVPGSTFTVEEPAVGPGEPFGPEHVQVTVSTDHARTVGAAATVWVVPWAPVAVVLVALALAVVLAGVRRRCRRRPSRRATQDGGGDPRPVKTSSRVVDSAEPAPELVGAAAGASPSRDSSA